MNGTTSNIKEGTAVDPLMKWFVISAGLILGLTGLAKLWSAFGDVKLLMVPDPITGLSFRNMMLLAAAAELPIAAACFFKPPRLATTWVAWLATNFLIYRLDLWWMGWKKPCGCLGNLTDTLGITPHTADVIPAGVSVHRQLRAADAGVVELSALNLES